MKISDIRATTVTVPLEAPLRHSNGAHWGRFVRTIVEVETDNGLVGVGEMGGGGESAQAAIAGLKPYLVGHDPLQLEQLRWKLMNPVASLYNNRLQLHAAVEFACMDVAGKFLNVRACDLLGGALREEVPFASYLFYRYRDKKSGKGGEVTADEMVAHARDLTRKYGFKTHKLKCGLFEPDHDVEVFRALGAAFPDASLRIDPNSVWGVEEGIRVGRAIEDLNNDYFEDPTWGMEGMRRLRKSVNIPTATNTVVVNFEQLAACIRTEAVDVILLDTTFWGGLRQAYKAGQVLETFQWGCAVHSSGELGIQLATMLHLGASLPNLGFAADAHYHHLADDIIKGGKMQYRDGKIALPKGPGLGVEIDRDKLAEYAELYRELGGYTYDRDPGRPNWYTVMPERNYADPKNGADSPVVKVNDHIFAEHVELMPGVPLNVYALRGADYSVIIDTGIAQMRDQIVALCREAGDVRYALITHAHADHIGCNQAVRATTGARFAAAGAFPWIEDMEVHYREFCLLNDELPDSPAQRAEIFSLMDGAVHVDVELTDGTSFRLGGDLVLETVTLPGHKLEEVGFLDRARGDLFMGDLLLALAAPFFHGFQTARGFHASLDRVSALIDSGVVRRVFPAHHAPLDPISAKAAVAQTRAFLDEVRAATIKAATGTKYPDLWRAVCKAMGKTLEFRGYAMLEVQVDELVEEGALKRSGGLIGRA